LHMMKIHIWFCTVIAAMLAAGLLLYANVPKLIRPREPDLVALNEIAKQAALSWNEPEPASAADTAGAADAAGSANATDAADSANSAGTTGAAGLNFAYRFTIIDNAGNVRRKTDADLPESIPDAVRRGFVPVDIIVGEKIVGKALVEVSPEDELKDAGSKLAAAALISFAALCALNAASMFALHMTLVRPFWRLQSFAHKISTGKFDEPLPMGKNNAFGLFTQSFDVMRASLLEARQNQLRAEREKKELVASLSHDVKTPVTSIRLIAELLQVEIADPAASTKLRTIELKADQIDRLMNDMMHNALEELGELKVNPSTVGSAALRELFESADHQGKVRIGRIPECLIEIDVMRMEQVIGNIIANSYKYAGTQIDVEFDLRDGMLCADVGDYGAGVGADEIEYIATKFYRGENAKASHKEGEGLGLYIAGQLMDKMGGGLEAFNRADEPTALNGFDGPAAFNRAGGFTVRLWIRLSR